jgi:hypothetical protein
VIALFAIACTSQNLVISEVVVLRDITDKQLAQPNVDEILSLFNLENKWNGGIFRFTDLTNVSYNQTVEIKLQARNEWLSNELDRDKEIKQFKNNISETISNSEKEAVGKDNSSVYFPIAKELNRLSQSTSTKKVLLVYSDLMENTAEMSFYDNQNYSLLKTNPGSIRKYFDSQFRLNNLSEIKIYLVYQPLNIGEDEIYKVVSGFYKNLFESKGAEVEITAGIN